MALEQHGKRQLRADAISPRARFLESIEDLAVARTDQAAILMQGLAQLPNSSSQSGSTVNSMAVG
jgi:hypothetical protein